MKEDRRSERKGRKRAAAEEAYRENEVPRQWLQVDGGKAVRDGGAED